VLHEEHLEFVDGQGRVALLPLQTDAQPALVDTGPRHELGQLFVDSELWVPSGCGVDGVPGHEHAELHLGDGRLALEPDHAGKAPARPASWTGTGGGW
jgi:hypothetical protein